MYLFLFKILIEIYILNYNVIELLIREDELKRNLRFEIVI